MLRALSIFVLLLTCTLSFALSGTDIAGLSAAATKERFQNADTVLLKDSEIMTCQRDGTAVETDEFYQKVLTESGKNELRTLTLSFNRNYESAEFVTVEILRNGRKIGIDIPKNQVLSTSSGQMSSNIFDPEIKVLTLTVPDLEIGDILHVKTVRKTEKPVIPGEWSSINPLESDMPILEYDVIISTPEEMPLQHAVIKNEIRGTVKTFPVEKRDSRLIYRWQARNVPQAIPEPDMPALYSCSQRLLTGTVKSWQDISKWYYRLCRPHMDAVSDEMRSKVKELTAGTKNPDEKMEKIFKYVSQNIRYTGITAEKDSPGFEPHDVRDTFKQKHGVCRDKAALLVSMLELAGFKAFPVLFMAGTPKDSEVPNGYFNHATVCVDKGSFDYVLMDPTDENTRTLFPEYLSNQSYLVARPEGDTLRRSPVIPAGKNLISFRTSGEISNNNSISGKCEITFTGICDLIYRSSFARMNPEKRREFLQSGIRRIMPGAELDTLEITPAEIRDTSQKLKVVFKFKGSVNTPAGDRHFLIDMPLFSRSISPFDWLLPDMAKNMRRFPIQLDSTCAVDEVCEIKIPEKFTVTGVPAAKKGKSSHFSWEHSFKNDSGRILCVNRAALDHVEITPEEYRNIRKETQARASAVRRLPAVKDNSRSIRKENYSKVFPEADSVVISENILLKLDSATEFQHTVSKKVQILNYSGIKKNSEIKIPYYPDREKVEITAAILQPDGSRVTLKDKDIRIMDAPWCADIKSLPPQKIMICALPDVGVNSVIEYTVKSRGRTVYPLSSVEYASGASPKIDWKFTLDAPENLRLYTSPGTAKLAFTRQRLQDRTIRTWSISNSSAVPEERSQCDLRLFYPAVSLTVANTKSTSEIFDRILKEKSCGKSEQAAELLKQNPQFVSGTTASKAKAVADFVVRKVRISGPSLAEIPEHCIKTSDEVLADGSGTSADRAVLMSSLFTKAGIPHEFVLATRHPFIPAVLKEFSSRPDMAFDGVLLYVPELQSFFNSSTIYAPPGYTSYNGMIGLNTRHGKLMLISSKHPANDALVLDYKVKLQSSGRALVEVAAKYRGKWFESMNRTLSESTPEELARFFEKAACGVDPQAVLTGRYSFDFSGREGIVKYSFTTPEYAFASGSNFSFAIPGVNLLRTLASVPGKNRKTPYMRSESLTAVVSCSILLPDGCSTEGIADTRESAGNNFCGNVISRRTSTSREVRKYIRLQLPAAIVEPVDFDRLIEIQQFLDVPSIRYETIKLKERK